MRLFNLRMLCCILAVIILSGCSNSQPLLVAPEQVTYDDELKIAQISQQLSSRDLDTPSRMQLIFERGIIYDSLGFKAFAQSDFKHLLSFNPEIPD